MQRRVARINTPRGRAGAPRAIGALNFRCQAENLWFIYALRDTGDLSRIPKPEKKVRRGNVTRWPVVIGLVEKCGRSLRPKNLNAES